MSERVTRFATHPPPALRLLAVPLLALMVWSLAEHRGLGHGLLAAAVYGPVLIPFAVAPVRVSAWSRRHPHLDGAVLGPLVLGAVAFLTHQPIWVAVLAGVVGSGLGVALGERRRRRVGR
ncbi:hypothetical protein [Angustibacter aerolatus]|uniref:Uncharacterized protein n=1 Tax=Angustibacter aerolatus TaxID=1162965 RepID=A0ABQ6JFS1_9ACTN|nr:hypothetical protein [Angustibacter aerolatus]GMA85675.1 hypothetical protein GCM10025868_09250 [Angustibacter aerolatus]